MPDIQAFRGVRYDLGHVGALSDVVAPPYDVISTSLQDELYRRHPANVIRLELNREEPGDDVTTSRYQRAARFIRDWRSQGVLFTEAQPALYVYHQQFTYGGHTHTRRGFMCRMRLEAFGTGKVFPHEETMSGPKADRLNLYRATKMNLSQIFGLYPDADNAAQNVLEYAVADQTPLVANDHLGVAHRLWPVTDLSVIGKATALMGPHPLFIADGHHRYETGLNYRNELAAAGPLDPNHPANFILMMCISMNDPGLLVLPTHRLFRGLPNLTAPELVTKLGEFFTTQAAGQGAALASQVWEEIETRDQQATLGLFTQADQTWTLATLTAAGRARMEQLASDHTPAWRELGVSILHRLLIGDLLGGKELPNPKYVHLVEEVVDSVASGEFALAALVMPATVEHIREISSSGERMPAKSTYFYPKLLSGLVFNTLDT